MALNAGQFLVFEIPLVDEKNENSVTIVHYEYGLAQDDLRGPLVNMIMMQYLDEPFFDNLRTK